MELIVHSTYSMFAVMKIPLLIKFMLFRHCYKWRIHIDIVKWMVLTLYTFHSIAYRYTIHPPHTWTHITYYMFYYDRKQ